MKYIGFLTYWMIAMTPKQRNTLSGNIDAACIILNEVAQEIFSTPDVSKELLAALDEARLSTRKLLRTIGYEGYIDDRPDSKEASGLPDGETPKG